MRALCLGERGDLKSRGRVVRDLRPDNTKRPLLWLCVFFCRPVFPCLYSRERDSHKAIKSGDSEKISRDKERGHS